MKKLLLSLIAIVGFAFTSNAQEGISENFYQASMEAMVKTTSSLYNKDAKVFLQNVSKHDGTVLTQYQTSLLLEVHSNYESSFGKYNVDTLKDFKSYDGGYSNTSATAKVNKKTVCAIIQGIIGALEAFCAWYC